MNVMTPEHAILYLGGLLLGMAFGSFIGCAIYRLPRGIPLWQGRSACPSCHNELAPRELVPVFSYAFQRGRCRHCKSRMSAAYFWAELASGFIGVGIVFILIQLKTI